MRKTLITGLFCIGSSAFAQDTGTPEGIDFTIGLGASNSPAYFGADDRTWAPTGSFSLNSFVFGPISYGLDGQHYGFAPKASLRFVGERDASAYDRLNGLPDVDPSLELGGGVQYVQPDYELYAVARYGVIGHESVVGELGGDLIFRPSAGTELRVGPRVLIGDDSYAQTYFGISEAAADTSVFDSFNAVGGTLSRGVEASLSYDFTDDWGVTGTVRYDELVNDAARSPISETDDQLSISVIVTRDVSFSF